MFSDGGPDIRWVGNERGTAGDPCWATLNAADFLPGAADAKRLNRGDRPGTHWLPAECDVSIRPGWFYHPGEDDKVKSPNELVDLYYKSVGRGAVFLLNVPPDRRGRIHEIDAKSLREFRRILDVTFGHDLGSDAKITASKTRGNDARFSPKNVTDGQRDTYWATDDDTASPEIILDLGKPASFSVARLREYLPLGQRIEEFALDQWKGGQWAQFASGTSIGNCRLIRGEVVVTDRVRLRILKSSRCPALSEIGLFSEPR